MECHLPPFGFVFDPEGRARTIQPQAETSFALIPDWLRIAHFLASSRWRGRSAGRSAEMRSVCRVRSLVRQVSNRVVRRIINDTIGIKSHDRTLAHLWRRLAALPVTTPTRLHLASVHPPSGIRHPPSEICHPPFRLPHSPFQNPQSAISETLPASTSARGAGPTGSGGAARMPGCNPAPRGRIARRPRRPRFPLLGQQLLEPADVPLDDRADEDQRRVLIAGRRGDLAIGHNSSRRYSPTSPSALVPELVADAVAQRIEGMEEGIEFRVECALIPRLPMSPTNRTISGSPQVASRSTTFSISAQRASNQRQPSGLSSRRRTITAG